MSDKPKKSKNDEYRDPGYYKRALKDFIERMKKRGVQVK